MTRDQGRAGEAEGGDRRAEEVLTARAPFLGHGLGLRREHYAAILAGESAGDWLEAISENYMAVGGRARAILRALRERYPMTLHGVSLGIGGTDPIDEGYLDALKALAAEVEPAWVSDHLCWTSVGGHTSHDLLPLPYTEESLANVVSRVAHVQERLGRVLVLENVSSYVGYRVSTMPEWEFVAEVARRSGCGLLFDVNNVFVSATNHGFDARTYLRGDSAGERVAVPPGGAVGDGAAARRHARPPGAAGGVGALPRGGGALRRGVVAGGVGRPHSRAGGGACRARQGGGDRGGGAGGEAVVTLRDVQRLFFGLITAPEGVAKTLDEREAHGAGAAAGRAAVAEVFAGDARMSAEDRLDAYANMYFFRLRDVLAEDFERTAAALGEARWHNLVTDYLLAHPPTKWSLRWAGEALPEFLRRHAYGTERPWLADVAALEWARNEAFQAVDAEPLSPEALAALPPEAWPELRFEALPGTALVESRWDLAAWWHGAVGEPQEAPTAVEAHQVLVVWRDAEDDVRHEALAADEVEAVRRLFSGAPFADVCEACSPQDAGEAEAEAAGRKAVELLLRWAVCLGRRPAPADGLRPNAR